MKKYKKIILIFLISLIIDIVSKILITNTLEIGKSITIIKDFFNLTLVYNMGAAFSILTNERLLLSIISILAIIFIIIMIRKEKEINKLNTIYYGLILAGIVGNLVNRLFLGYVIDFFDFNIFGYDYPIFNIADCMIVISIILMIIEIIIKDVVKNVRSK